ncbi:MAG: hypothetical protein A2V92_02340 [Candidatus Muproteobacteria bacterium RBG_16_65_31]|uniref:Uncharacterized protein n=1 Tax=Candidatus Muproteobacteria bacterium RBG_16_65_31 TaxID=1817759 RepID=A0A1F6TJB0_9PROT|nr:MAG: hypothetical protein A2V92_02340 [Candidatus Muproteobacteria bacterium RBG_16_65_31]
MMRYRHRLWLGVFALLAGCVTVGEPPISDKGAVVALVDTARADGAAGKTDSAAAALERALRIEPQNPALWRELALLRLRQGEPQQAESLAAKSNTWAGSNKKLRAANWRLIAQARRERGDDAGARAALEKAEQER